MISYDLDLSSGVRVCVRFTDAADGNFAPASNPEAVALARQAVSPHPWTWLRQVHGTNVVTVDAPAAHAGAEGDAAITAVAGATIGIQTADCVPIILMGDNGVVGAAHAGWKGAAGGVAVATVDAMRSLNCGPIKAIIGPAISPECYEFGQTDLDTVAASLGDVVRAETAAGAPALDLAAGLRVQLESLDVAVELVAKCTACEGQWYSHRARVDKGRQASVVWIEP